LLETLRRRTSQHIEENEMPFRAAALILALLASPLAEGAEPTKSIAVGDKVPDYTVSDLEGKAWKLSDLHRKAGLKNRTAVVLTFWCSFCHSCRHVEGHLDRLAKDYDGKAAVFALDASAGETAESVAEFANEKGLSVPFLLNADGSLADLFGTGVTTTTVVIDAEGILRYCGQFGHAAQPFAEDALKAVLAGKDVPVKATLHRG
jgi:thiol-disulfide isomerase/thioredoxin